MVDSPESLKARGDHSLPITSLLFKEASSRYESLEMDALLKKLNS
ncbi:MAG: Uncharacterised protein [Bacteroidetes bacterium MED-G17]|nr:MAG: Uncharacterised protein [Bacteroidetes bacterium MED-G17]